MFYKKQKYSISSPRTSANKYHIFIRGGSWAGYTVFIYVVCFSRSFSVLFMLLGFCLCFRLVLLSCCSYNRKHTHIKTFKTRKINKRLGENINKHRQHRNTLFPSRNLINIYSRSGPGLDILYLYVCFNVFIEAFLCFISVWFLMCSPSLVKLLHLQSKTHIKYKKLRGKH